MDSNAFQDILIERETFFWWIEKLIKQRSRLWIQFNYLDDGSSLSDSRIRLQNSGQPTNDGNLMIKFFAKQNEHSKIIVAICYKKVQSIQKVKNDTPRLSEADDSSEMSLAHPQSRTLDQVTQAVNWV